MRLRAFRAVAFVIICLSGSVVGLQVMPTVTGESADYEFGEQIAPPASNTTVIVTNEWGGTVGGRSEAEIMAVGPSGKITYYNDTFDSYNDVDPLQKKSTVLYLGHLHLPKSACNSSGTCVKTHVMQLNLSTGNQSVLYTHRQPTIHNGRWHDADLINDTHLAVADIVQDRAFIVDLRTGQIVWEWRAEEAFSHDTGGSYPGDWTHINDIEVLEDGRLLLNLRNQDQSVFLTRSGMQHGWTLGSENNHSRLYEPHNPDYIPRERGGPAIVIADSENNRVVEYQRQNGSWQRTWKWSDSDLQWPRDADRLPNGHTLITDSNGNRIVEVNMRGEVVWEMGIGLPYEAERLETGDESMNGPSAKRVMQNPNKDVGASPMVASEIGPVDRLTVIVMSGVPAKLQNSLLFILPGSMNLTGVTALGICLFTLIFWGLIEAWYSPRISMAQLTHRL